MDNTRTSLEKAYDLEKLEVVVPSTTSIAVAAAATTTTTTSSDKALERRLLLKCDLHVLPILWLLFLIAFVDRTNIANAKIEGLEKGLNMHGNDYNVALLVFIVSYVLFEVPSNLVLKNVRPAPWLSGMMFAWGVCSMSQGLAQNFGGLIAARFLMGLFEAGFVPGCAYLIGAYYKRHEFQLRYSLFFSAAIFAGAFSAFLAYLIEKMDGIGGYAGWRWIFILEGVATILVSTAAYFIIVPWPEKCTFLTTTEKALLLKRLDAETGIARMDTLDRAALWLCLTDWKIWVGMLAYFCAQNSGSSIAYFIPSVVQDLGYTAAEAQIHTIPVFMAALVGCVVTAWVSDRLQHRYGFVMMGAVMAGIGWALELARVGPAGVRYFGLFLVTVGTYTSMPMLVVWMSNNLGGRYKRAVGMAIQIGGGNASGFVAANVFIAGQAPNYPVGFGVGFALIVIQGVLCTGMVVGLWMENRKREKGERDCRLQLPAQVLENIGDDHPLFRFTL